VILTFFLSLRSLPSVAKQSNLRVGAVPDYREPALVPFPLQIAEGKIRGVTLIGHWEHSEAIYSAQVSVL
jgi:hypothetical protein